MTHTQETFRVMDAGNTPFGKQKKFSISRNFAVLLVLLFIGCVTATGLLVYHFTSCNDVSHVNPKEIFNHATIDSIIPTEGVKDAPTTSVSSHPTITTTISPAEKVVDVRLPTSMVPHSYEIKLIPFIEEGNFTFHGEATILVNVSQPTNNITLHADDLEIEDSSLSVSETFGDPQQDFVNIPIAGTTNDTERQFFIIYVNSPLQPGHQYYIHIKYVGNLNDKLQGFYRSSYTVQNQIRWIAATQFQPTDARKAFPCFDEPALKAKFKISLGRLKNMTSISNMPRLGYSQPMTGHQEYEWDHYQESVPMSTYLVAFVVSDFGHIRNGSFSVWAHKEVLNQTRYSLQIGPKILAYFEEFFHIKFPLPKIDMIAIPDFSAGAMENWGLITYRESAMLYEEGVSTKMNLQRIATIVSHELAHQWFGNLVTPKWWTDLWLNEGFASYMEYLGANAVNPEWRIIDQFAVHEVQNVFTLDALKSSHQISIKVNNPIEINDIFDRISYAKGATIIRMMEHFLTTDVFRKGLTNYLNDRQYSSAEQDDLWQALTQQAHEDGVFEKDMSVKKIMDTWTLQTGFPVVTVHRKYDDNSATLEQERFLLEKANENNDLSMWWIPITYQSYNSTEKSVWMRGKPEITIQNFGSSPTEWVLVNIQQTGYYRVDYDLSNWQMLTRQLLDEENYLKISAANRAQLLDDALNLAVAGYLDYEVALNVTQYLVHEREFVPWKAAFNALDYLFDMLVHTAHFDKYKKYMLYITDGIYRDVGFSETPTDDQLTVYTRIEVLWRSCLLGSWDCMRNSVIQFQNWRNSPDPDNNNPISPDLKSVVYCTAIRAGGQEEWDFAWTRYLNTNVVSEKEVIMSALGCSKETWILSRYLHWAVTEESGIRKQDAARVFTAVSANVIGHELAYKFFKNNWDKIKKHMGSSVMTLNSIAKACTSDFNSQQDLDDLKAFVKRQGSELTEVARTLQQSIEQIEVNVRWMKNYYLDIVQWLSSFKAIS